MQKVTGSNPVGPIAYKKDKGIPLSFFFKENVLISRNVSKLLRSLAILIVIASHYAEWYYLDHPYPMLRHAISTWGPPGVDIFFLLSGYGLYKSFKSAGKIDGLFILKRILAVYLPYILLELGLSIYHREMFFTSAEGLVNFFTAGEFWFLNVIFVIYIAFILCFAFGRKAALPILACAVTGYSIWLNESGHFDFWTLSNHAFLIGIIAAAGEERFPKLYTRRNELILMTAALAGAVISFFVMQKYGGSGQAESYAAELVMNIFISLAVLGAAYLLPDIKTGVFGLIGEASLFIYILHTTMFYAIIFKLEKLGLGWGIVITAAITIVFAVILYKLYSLLSAAILKKCVKA